mgnify:FL=1|jgi:branched-chain amino acid aminotransferase|tara:strand:+ start:641 stop:1552 length:912 start_codon:yes stop_codon:yes gene_type:complete
MASTHDYKDDERNKDILIYINGEFHHRLDAKVSVMDSGYLLGDGVWEGIRLHKGKLIHLNEHLTRLYSGAEAIAMDIGIEKRKMTSILYKTLQKNNMQSGVHIRLIVSRGIKKTPYQHPKVTITKPTVVIIPEYKSASEDVKQRGITIATVKTRRDNRTQDPRINSLSKHNCIAACIEADRLGVDEGLMLDPFDNIATCNSTNFFIVRNNEVWTSTGEYCLNGITRGNIIRLCREYNIPVYEKDFKQKDVHTADEVFVTGTFAGVIPVISVDGINIKDGSCGPLSKSLQDWYALDIEKIVTAK